MHITPRSLITSSVAIAAILSGCDRIAPAVAAVGKKPTSGAGSADAPPTLPATKPAAAPIPRPFEPLPQPSDRRLQSLYEAQATLRLLAEDVAAYRVDPSPARLETIRDRATHVAVVGARARAELKPDSAERAGPWLTRSVVYRTEVAAQLEMLHAESPAAHRVLCAALRDVQPAVLEAIPSLTLDGQSARQTSQCRALRAQIELFKLQHHGGGGLDLRMGWTQLLKRTDAAGRITDAGKFGPYLDAPPANPQTGGSRIRVLTAEPARIPLGGHAGYDFVYHTPSGRLYSLDSGGRLFGESADVTVSVQQAKPASAKLPAIRPSVKPKPNAQPAPRQAP